MKNRAVLIKREGSQAWGPGQRFEITTPAVLGRSADATVVVDGDPNVSRQHCRIEFEANEFLLRDLQSANGTYLNAKRVSTAALRHGDVISVGDTTFTFQTWAPAPREVSVPGAVAAARLPPGKTPFDSIDPKDSSLARMGVALEKYKLLYQVGELIASLDRPERFFPLVLERIFDRLPADRGIVLVGTDPDALEMAATRARVPEAGRVPISSTILRRVFQTGESLLFADTQLDDRLYGAESVTGGASRCIVCASLSHADQVVGAIQIESIRQPGAFDENDLQLLAAIGRQVAAALVGLRQAEQRERRVLLAELRRSLPLDLAEQLLPDRERWTRPARVPVVVMVADLRRLLDAGPEADPAAVFGRAREALDLLEGAVFGQQGAVGKLTADALMGLWGAPLPCEDAPLRAARAALECVERVPGVGVGVHAGPALVGTFGGSYRRDYTAQGRVVDVASRLCGLAAPGEVLLTEPAHELLFGDGLGAWREVERLEGLEGPARLFRLRSLVAV
ncbi:MAG TPA: FHA domain-containing protein [Myxococcales bacterium]|nr:FHA domain-containing protein [Myxococcales bacterium]